MKFAYLLIMLFTLSYPLYKSFEDKINYYSKWKFVFKSALPAAGLFMLWDNWFTAIGVWEFNSKYTLDLFIGYLPLEEYLFFLFVPFSCLFIYEVMNYFVKKDILGNYSTAISWYIIAVCSLLLILHFDKIYPFILFSLIILTLLFHILILKADYLGRFYLSFSVCILPFLIVNGLLTGLPIIIYNDLFTSGIRIYTIPIEDLFYGMLFLMIIVTLYEKLKTKNKADKIGS